MAPTGEVAVIAEAMSEPEVMSGNRGSVHEYVGANLDDVMEILRACGTVPGAEAEFSHRELVRVPVRIGDLDANLLAVRIVGGRQDPVTELILVSTHREIGLPPSAARRFVDGLLEVLETELRLPAARAVRGSGSIASLMTRLSMPRGLEPPRGPARP